MDEESYVWPNSPSKLEDAGKVETINILLKIVTIYQKSYNIHNHFPKSLYLEIYLWKIKYNFYISIDVQHRILKWKKETQFKYIKM